MIKYYSVNGTLVPADAATLGVSDLAILRGYGMFDFFLVKNGRPLFLEDYLDRVEKSAAQLHLHLPVTREELSGQIMRVIRANGLPDASMRLVLTGGYAEDGYSPSVPNLLIMEYPFPHYPPSRYTQGVKLMLHEYQRTFPSAKSINYLVGIYLLPQQKAAGADDVLFHHNGLIYETTRANFFIVKQDGTIVTAADGILEGITRKKLLEVARRHFRVEERNLSMEELKTASEAFITSSTKRVMPVVQVGDVVIGDGKPGEVTHRLLDLLKAEEEAYIAALTIR